MALVSVSLRESLAMNAVAQRIVLAFALLCLPATAQAQPSPTGPISLVVPLAPGDAADIAARAMGEEISRLLNTSVVVINRPGVGGAVGTNYVVQARKDGHTILFAQNSALTFRAVLDPQAVTCDALRDLAPLGTASAARGHRAPSEKSCRLAAVPPRCAGPNLRSRGAAPAGGKTYERSSEWIPSAATTASASAVAPLA